MYTSVKTRKKRRYVGPTCLKIPGENTAYVCVSQVGYVQIQPERGVFCGTKWNVINVSHL